MYEATKLNIIEYYYERIELDSYLVILCEEGRIDGVVRFGQVWAIPKNAGKPSDGRLKRGDTNV